MINLDIYLVIEAIAQTSSRAEKEALLGRYADMLKPILQAAYDPYRTYGVNKIPDVSTNNRVLTGSVEELLCGLEKRLLTGQTAQEEVASWLSRLSAPEGDLLMRILRKDLRMGVSNKTINKVIPGCVPEFGCMLAQPFDPSRAKYPMFAQPKLDGVRVVADVNVEAGVVQWFSRSGKPFTTFDHLNEVMVEMVKATGRKRSRFDGEVVTGSFNKTVSEARKKRAQALDAQYHIFDWIDDDVAPQPYRDRYQALWSRLTPTDDRIQIVPITEVRSQEAADGVYQKHLDAGFEGTMLKDPDAPYQHKRSYAWMKLKEEQSIDVSIIDWVPGTGKYLDMIGALTINHNGIFVNVGSGLTDELRSVNPDTLMGRLIEVSYQHETPDGSLRHPRFKRFRDTEHAPGIKV